MFLKNLFTLSNLVLVTALTLSGIAAWYSILGLVAIFAAAAIPIIIMGGALEFAKVVTTVWLHRYWGKVKWSMKLYLVPAVISLAFLTSMGIFGFLSKAHMDQGIVSGDSQAKLNLIDEKIKTQRDNIELARKALTQMDNQVDARLSRGDSENGAERAVQIRRQQAGERSKLQKEIGEAQKEIARLNEERAPIAAENRKIEAEVGPIKYIAALIYGDNPDANLLERAVRWVIILIVLVFDPLALTLVIAANSSRAWERETVVTEKVVEELEDTVETKPAPWPTDWKEWDDDAIEKVSEETINEIKKEEQIVEHKPETHPYLNQGFKYPAGWMFEKPMVYNPEPVAQNTNTIDEEKFTEEKVKDIEKKLAMIQAIHAKEPEVEPAAETQAPIIEPTADSTEIVTEGVTKLNPVKDLGNGYVIYDDRSFSKDALKELQPSLFAVKADSANTINTNFGTEFPKMSNKGDVFVRVDILPNKVFKFDGKRWIEINKTQSDSYLSDNEYIQFLISKIESGEYDIELLTEQEKQQVEEYLKNHNT